MTASQSELSGMQDDAAGRVGWEAYAALKASRAKDPAFILTATTLSDALRTPLAKELAAPRAKPLRTKRNPLFDAISHGFGHNGSITRAAAGAIARALKEILEVDPDVTPDDLTRGCAYVRRKFENCGPMALSSNWHEISKRRTERTRTSKQDIYQEPPAGWRDAAAKRFPDAADWTNPHVWSTMAWRDVSTTIRPDVLKAMT